ncbi:nucleoside triphosphate pyrophosphatase [Croceicoccus hydrothermalis]|uniref:Maf family protein n=1 Tax=Croceicoccus hydrothermalis TaxID=2867964 RepID=UPI0030842A4C
MLASRSASRRAMLDGAGVHYTARPADVDEAAIKTGMAGEQPGKIAQALADAKALAIAKDAGDALVLGSDSLVQCGGRLFDKPENREQAVEHLRWFSRRKMELHSAAALVQHGTVQWRHTALALLRVRELSDAFIASYLDSEWPDVGACVGVFMIEGRGVQLFESVDGDYFSILGMPLFPVLSALRRFGAISS